MTVKVTQSIRAFSRANYRHIFWILLVALTAGILAVPVQLSYQYRSVQSPYIFENLPLFGLVYSIWVALVLLLLVTKREENHWEGPALVAIFALVFLGFWSVIAPDRQADGLMNIATAKYVASEGTISSHKNVGYLDFPGLHIMAASLSQIAGLELFHIVTVILLFNALLLASLLYFLFSKSLRNSHLAAFAVLLVIQGNWTQSLFAFFWPRYMGLIFLAAFLVLLNRKEGSVLASQPDALAMFLLLPAAAVTYFVTSMSFFFIVLGIYLMQRVARPRSASGEVPSRHPGDPVGWSTVALCLVIPMTWELYYAVGFLGGIVNFFPKLIENLASGQLLGSVFLLGGANLGGAIPLWATLTRWFWLIFIYAVGAVLALRNLFRLRKVSSIERVEIGGLLGVGAVGVIGLVLAPGGFEGQRILMYSPLFFVPLILRFLWKAGNRMREYVFIGLAAVFLVLSFPTFLAHNSRISTDAYYPYEYASGGFVASAYGKGEGVDVFHYGDSMLPVIYSGVRDADYHGVWDVRNEADFWRRASELIGGFLNSEQRENLIFSERGKGSYEHILGVKPTDPRWDELEQRVSSTDKIYDNGHVQIYGPTR